MAGKHPPLAPPQPASCAVAPGLPSPGEPVEGSDERDDALPVNLPNPMQ